MGGGTWLVLDILHEAVASFSQKECLDAFWPCVCRNACWIVPAHRMCVLLYDEEDRCEVAGQIESGQILTPPQMRFAVGNDEVAEALRSQGSQWFIDPGDGAQEHDALRRWLWKDKPAALLTVPIQVEHKTVGALLFVLKTFNAADQSMLNALVVGYALYVGMTYTFRNTMTELQAIRLKQQRLLDEIEAKNVELETRNAEIQAKNVVLESQNGELERFTYTVSHDLKTPLVTIKGFLGLLEQDLSMGNTEAVAKDMAQINNAADKMALLLAELLELSRIGRLMNRPEPVHLSKLADEVVSLVAGRIVARGVTVKIDPAMPVVLGDRVRLLEVYQNLIENAIKFMGEQPKPRVEVGAQPDHTQTLCYVRDNGIGIAPDHQEKVFGLFERLDQQIEGTGIGLALTKRIVEVHGGRIWVESEGEGHGSTFWF